MRLAVIARLTTVGGRLLKLGDRLCRPAAGTALDASPRVRGLLKDPVDQLATNLELTLERLDTSVPPASPMPRTAGGADAARPFAPEWPAPSRAAFEPFRTEPPSSTARGARLPRAESPRTSLSPGPAVAPRPAAPRAVTAPSPGRRLAAGRTGDPAAGAHAGQALPSVQATPRETPLLIPPPDGPETPDAALLPDQEPLPPGSAQSRFRETPLRVPPPGGLKMTGMAPPPGEGLLPVGAARTSPEPRSWNGAPTASGQHAGGDAPSGALRLAPDLGRLSDLLRANLAQTPELPVHPASAPLSEDAPLALERVPPPVGPVGSGAADPTGAPREEVAAGTAEASNRPGRAGVGLLDAEHLADALADHLELELLRVYGTSGR